MILACGGPRVTNELAKELGYDAGFSKGTEPQHLATFLARELAAREPARALRRPAAAGALSELTAPAARVALVGLAKNTGKTVALTSAAGRARAGRAHRRGHLGGARRRGARRDRRPHREAPRARCRRAACWRPPTSCCAPAGCRTSCSSAPRCARRWARCWSLRLKRRRDRRGGRAERGRSRCARCATRCSTTAPSRC